MVRISLLQTTTQLRMQEFITADTAVFIEIFVPMSSGPMKLFKITSELSINSKIISRIFVGLVLIYISHSVFFSKNVLVTYVLPFLEILYQCRLNL